MRVIRLDWRLIHSNTIDFWVRPLGLNGIVLCDAQVASDPMRQLGLRLMCPEGIAVRFVHPEALCKTQEPPQEHSQDHSLNCLLLFRDLNQYRASGLRLDPGDVIAISPHQPLSPEELDHLAELAEQGIQTTFEAILSS